MLRKNVSDQITNLMGEILSLYCHLSPKDIAEFIKSADSQVLYSAPSINDLVAAAIIDANYHLEPGNCTVILDYDEQVFRLGYGINEAVQMMIDAGVEIRKQAALRIGTLVVDDAGWIFNLSPMAVESQNKADECNAIRLTKEQIVDIWSSIKPTNTTQLEITLAPDKDIPGVDIGRNLLTEQEVRTVTKAINENPPQAFDLQRIVNIYRTHLQFVELELEGGRIEQHTLKISNELQEVILVAGKNFGKQFKGSFRLIDDLKLEEFNKIRKELHELRDNYAPSVGKRIGRVILKTRLQEFKLQLENIEARLKRLSETDTFSIAAGIDHSLRRLAEEFAPAVKKNPPPKLQARCSGEITHEIARTYLFDLMKQAAPTAEHLLKKIKLHYIPKDVTYEMLKAPTFQQRIKKLFPHENWAEPLEETDAAQARQQMESVN